MINVAECKIIYIYILLITNLLMHVGTFLSDCNIKAYNVEWCLFLIKQQIRQVNMYKDWWKLNDPSGRATLPDKEQ